MPVERELGGNHAAIPYVIRRAKHKSYLEIHREIRAFQTEPIQAARVARGVSGHDLNALAAAPTVHPADSRRQPPRSDAPGNSGGDCGVTALGTAGAAVAGAWRRPGNPSF
jgi:hypothetical protein